MLPLELEPLEAAEAALVEAEEAAAVPSEAVVDESEDEFEAPLLVESEEVPS